MARASERTLGWIVDPTEWCTHCGQGYAYELEEICVDCDSPMCPFCLLVVKEHRRCPDCHGAADEAGRDPEAN